VHRITKIRLVRWPYRLAYVVIGWFVLRWAVGRAFAATSADNVVREVVLGLLGVAVIGVGARIFRGAGEPVEPARARWRATSRSTLSFVLGGLFVATDLFGIPGIAYAISIGEGAEWYVAEALAFLFAILYAWFYLRSGVRLRRQELAEGPSRTQYPFHGRILDLDGPTVRIPVEESMSTSAGSDGAKALLSPSKDGRWIHVHVNGVRIGSLPGAAEEVRDLVARSGGRVRVDLARSGSQLVAEVPIDALVDSALNGAEAPA
jgi:hypothetical protein